MVRCIPIVILATSLVVYFLTRDHYDSKTVAGKRVLVTGTSSGIGEQLAYHYSELGARLVLTARRGDLLNKVKARCMDLGARQVEVVIADMSVSADRIRLMEVAKQRLDGGLDHVILNHAHLHASPWRSTPKNFTVLRSDMEINFFSHVELASLALPLLKAGDGHLGVVSSVAGKIGSPLSTVYCATKFAIQGFFTSWRQELWYSGSNVSVTLAVLGPVLTEAANAMIRSVNPNVDMSGIGANSRDTARAIVRAVHTRASQLHYGWAATVMVWTHKFFPEYFENFITSDYLKGYTL